MTGVESNVLPLLRCPKCGANAKARPQVVPGRAWLAVLPCSRCGAYAAFMTAEDGASRAWLLVTTPGDEAATGSG